MHTVLSIVAACCLLLAFLSHRVVRRFKNATILWQKAARDTSRKALKVMLTNTIISAVGWLTAGIAPQVVQIVVTAASFLLLLLGLFYMFVSMVETADF